MKRKMFVSLVAVIAILSLLSFALAQEKKPSGPPPVVQEMVAKAKTGLKTASAADLKAAVEKKEKVVLLDVRTSQEWAAGRLAGAVHVDRGTLEFNIWKAIPDQNANIIVYCKTGGRAVLAGKTVQDLGYKNVRVAEMNYEAWVKAGNPVVR